MFIQVTNYDRRKVYVNIQQLDWFGTIRYGRNRTYLQFTPNYYYRFLHVSETPKQILKLINECIAAYPGKLDIKLPEHREIPGKVPPWWDYTWHDLKERMFCPR